MPRRTEDIAMGPAKFFYGQVRARLLQVSSCPAYFLTIKSKGFHLGFKGLRLLTGSQCFQVSRRWRQALYGLTCRKPVFKVTVIGDQFDAVIRAWRSRSTAFVIVSRLAATPVLAICTSCSGVTPEAPMLPVTWPSTMTGTPPLRACCVATLAVNGRRSTAGAVPTDGHRRLLMQWSPAKRWHSLPAGRHRAWVLFL